MGRNHRHCRHRYGIRTSGNQQDSGIIWSEEMGPCVVKMAYLSAWTGTRGRKQRLRHTKGPGMGMRTDCMDSILPSSLKPPRFLERNASTKIPIRISPKQTFLPCVAFDLWTTVVGDMALILVGRTCLNQPIVYQSSG